MCSRVAAREGETRRGRRSSAAKRLSVAEGVSKAAAGGGVKFSAPEQLFSVGTISHVLHIPRLLSSWSWQ